MAGQASVVVVRDRVATAGTATLVSSSIPNSARSPDRPKGAISSRRNGLWPALRHVRGRRRSQVPSNQAPRRRHFGARAAAMAWRDAEVRRTGLQRLAAPLGNTDRVVKFMALVGNPATPSTHAINECPADAGVVASRSRSSAP
jgi:hypothetical protein